MPRHVTCVDCHNPHQIASAASSPPAHVPGRLRGVSGLSIAGVVVPEALQEYEVCLKCHGVRDQTTSPGVVRNDNTRNVRLDDQLQQPFIPPGRDGGEELQGLGVRAGLHGREPDLLHRLSQQ